MKTFEFNSIAEMQEKTKTMGEAEFLFWVRNNADSKEISNYLYVLSKDNLVNEEKYITMSLIVGALNKLIISNKNKTDAYITKIRSYFEKNRYDLMGVLTDWSCLGEKSKKNIYPISEPMRQILKDILIKDDWVF